jgi:hypothetical protein
MTSKVASTVAYAGRSERFHVPFTRRADRRSQCTHTISLQHEQLAVELKIGFAPVGAIRCIKPAKNSFLKRKNIAVRSTSNKRFEAVANEWIKLRSRNDRVRELGRCDVMPRCRDAVLRFR